MPLLEFTDRGIYCRQADVYIDPWKPVNKALITHGHADHARYGSKYYLCTNRAKPVIKYRLGSHINIEGIDFGQSVNINGVKISFHPAGHIIGSAQIRVEYQGEVWAASGDYKIQKDPLALDFEAIKCHTYITESTFGMPVYKWDDTKTVEKEINDWWAKNAKSGVLSIITAYSLGKAQRIIQAVDGHIGPIFTHPAIENTNAIIRAQGIDLRKSQRITQQTKKADVSGALVIAPPTAVGDNWLGRFRPFSVGVASGWMMLRNARKKRSADRGFVFSDHADWNGLNTAIKATGAEKIIVTHGYTELFSKWLREQGYDARTVKTQYEGEPTDENPKQEQ